MKNSIISRSLLLSFIGVILCISMFVGTTLAIFSITFKSKPNTVGVMKVAVTYDDTYGGDYTESLKDGKLFENVVLTSDSSSVMRFIKVRNDSGETVNFSVKAINTKNDTSGWKISSKVVSSGSNIQFDADYIHSFTTGTDISLVSDYVEHNSEKIVVVEVSRDDIQSTQFSSASFVIEVTVSQQSNG